MIFSYIFIGSTHGFINDFLKQKEIILEIKPEYVLCEDIQNIVLDNNEKFINFIKKKTFSDVTSFEEVRDLVNLCYINNIKLIGIDKNNFGLNNLLIEKIKENSNFTYIEEKECEKIAILREKLHIKNINHYKKKTSQTMVIILGSWHLRENGLLRKKLNNFKVILPCDINKKPIFEPIENNNNISYIEIIYK